MCCTSSWTSSRDCPASLSSRATWRATLPFNEPVVPAVRARAEDGRIPGARASAHAGRNVLHQRAGTRAALGVSRLADRQHPEHAPRCARTDGPRARQRSCRRTQGLLEPAAGYAARSFGAARGCKPSRWRAARAASGRGFDHRAPPWRVFASMAANERPLAGSGARHAQCAAFGGDRSRSNCRAPCLLGACRPSPALPKADAASPIASLEQSEVARNRSRRPALP